MSIEAAIDVGKVREAWTHILWWYRQARGGQAPQTMEELDEFTAERAEIYSSRLLEGLKVPLLVQKADTEDGISTEA